MKIYEMFSVIISQLTSKEFHDSKIKISGRVIMESPFSPHGSIKTSYVIQFRGLLS